MRANTSRSDRGAVGARGDRGEHLGVDELRGAARAPTATSLRGTRTTTRSTSAGRAPRERVDVVHALAEHAQRVPQVRGRAFDGPARRVPSHRIVRVRVVAPFLGREEEIDAPVAAAARASGGVRRGEDGSPQRPVSWYRRESVPGWVKGQMIVDRADVSTRRI